MRAHCLLQILLATNFLLFSHSAWAQENLQPDGGGSFNVPNKDELTEEQRKNIITYLNENKQALMKQGKWQAPVQQAVALQWVLKTKDGYNPVGYYGISNYIDHNPTYLYLQDYNCGTRSYDLSNGYGHKGTDIFNWPFAWYKMDNNLVEVIAGAPGTIIGKSDGNFDRHCAFCTTACNWNAVYIRHADGSVAWYGHLKSGTLTAKPVGATVSTGEYLGVVGSSGNSTSPHLHLELYTNDSYSKLVDPWAGPCNALNGNTSWWANQQPYWVPTLLDLMTHGAKPASGNCPESEAVNERKSFRLGQTVYFGSYYRDVQKSDVAVHTMKRPDGTVYQTWNQTFGSTYAGSWWYNSRTLPAQAEAGTWTYEITYRGVTQSTFFVVTALTPYEFTGSGAFSNAANWYGGLKPPNPVPSGTEVFINPKIFGSCEVDEVITFQPGSKLTVLPGKKVLLQSNLVVQ